MNLFKRSTRGFFASESLLGHLMRGGVAIGLLVWAIQHPMQPTLSIIAGMGALIAFRGCPICWSIGLIEIVSQKVNHDYVSAQPSVDPQVEASSKGKNQ